MYVCRYDTHGRLLSGNGKEKRGDVCYSLDGWSSNVALPGAELTMLAVEPWFIISKRLAIALVRLRV